MGDKSTPVTKIILEFYFWVWQLVIDQLIRALDH